jgi:hypothetical protein
MTKVLFIGLVALALATPAMAQDNTPSGVGADVACAPFPADCFAPSFSFVGQVVKYSGSGTFSPLTYEFADCCIGPDLYKGTLTSGGLKGSATTNDIVASTCTTSWTGGSAIRLADSGSSAKAQLKAVRVPGGFPATAYARMSNGTWVQTQGSDSCGF